MGKVERDMGLEAIGLGVKEQLVAVGVMIDRSRRRSNSPRDGRCTCQRVLSTDHLPLCMTLHGK